MKKFLGNLIALGFIVLMVLALFSGLSVLLGFEKPENIRGEGTIKLMRMEFHKLARLN